MLSRIAIRQQYGALAIETKRAEFTPGTRRYQMDAKSNQSQMKITSPLPRVQIDQTEAFYTTGNKTVMRMAGDYNRDSLRVGLQSIGRIAGDGLQMMQVERSGMRGKAVIEMAKRKLDYDTQLGIAALPSVRPEISVDDQGTRIEWSHEPPLSINWTPVETRGEYRPYEVNITWLRRPSIEITVEPGMELDFPVTKAVGRNIDAAL